MKIFISSVISGMEAFRDTAADAIQVLNHSVVRAEDFGASHETPRVACLEGVRRSDAMVLILGQYYGAMQSKGLSATHEEYREASDTCPVLVMVQQNVDPQPKQQEFIQEVQDWASGRYTARFSTLEELRDEIVRALHALELSKATGPADPNEILQRALSHLPDQQQYGQYYQGTQIALALASGPHQTVLRPAKLESRDLKEYLQKIALFGSTPVFELQEGTQSRVEGDRLVLQQQGRMLRLAEDGTLAFTAILPQPTDSLPAIIEEDVREAIDRFIRFGTEVLSHLDDTNRLSLCVVVAVLMNAGPGPWRTRTEHARSPNEITVSMFGTSQIQPVHLSPPGRSRSEMRLSGSEIADDLTIKLRREFRGSYYGKGMMR